MKLISIAFFFLCLLLCIEANAVSQNAQKKYPYVLLSNDYGILNENDLGDFSWGLQRQPFNPKMVFGGNYWQCFPRESIKITLKDTGSSSDDFGWRDNIANLKMEVFVNQYIVHVYEMRKNLSIIDFEKRFNKWRDIMNGEKYVCLAGDFINYEHKNENGIDRDVYGWIFEKIKTKKGCDSYLYSCHPTYAAYLRKKTEEASYKFRGNGDSN
ncbi:MAG: hypothetical protein ACYCQI_07715 [Gammaproteobacteria bacterium]